MEQSNKIVLFQEKQIRRVWHSEEWWFPVNDVIEVLTDSVNAADYFRKMLRRDKELEKGVGQSVQPLIVETTRGKQKLKCANTKTILRIIQSIPSPKAEPFKLWLADVGYERIQEIEDPELGIQRIKDIYKAKGYPDEWIERRLQTIEIRKQLTEEWKNRGVKEGQEYSILTAEIARATFGLSPSEHKDFKGLTQPTDNLRDHMTPLELIFTALGEEMTRALTVETDATGFQENAEAAQRGGRAAGKARIAAEKETGVKVVSSESFLKKIKSASENTGLPENKE